MRPDNQAILAAIEKKFLDLLESVPDAMVLSDHEGRIVLVNSNVERLFGYRRDDVVDKKVEILMPARFRSAHRKHRAAYYADPNIRPMGLAEVVRARRKDGTEFQAEINLSPVEIGGQHLVWSAIRSVNYRENLFAHLRAVMESALTSLGGLISVCAWCKRIRDEHGSWQQLETFLGSHSENKITHAMCPDCMRKLDPANRPVEKV